MLYGVHWRQGRSEGRRATDTLRPQSRGVIARGVDILSVGMQEYSECCQSSFATGLGFEVLTFLFVVWCPRDHAELHINKAIKPRLFKLSIACGLSPVPSRRAMYASKLVCSARRKRRLGGVQDCCGMAALI